MRFWWTTFGANRKRGRPKLNKTSQQDASGQTSPLLHRAPLRTTTVSPIRRYIWLPPHLPIAPCCCGVKRPNPVGSKWHERNPVDPSSLYSSTHRTLCCSRRTILHIPPRDPPLLLFPTCSLTTQSCPLLQRSAAEHLSSLCPLLRTLPAVCTRHLLWRDSGTGIWGTP